MPFRNRFSASKFLGKSACLVPLGGQTPRPSLAETDDWVFPDEIGLRMRLAELLSPCQILLDLKAGERWTAIVEMVDALVERGKLSATLRGEVLEALRAREDLVSTGVGRGVAIPHAFSEHLDHVVAMFGRSKAGIDFEAIDGGRVNFVVLFLVPKSAYAMHLHTLAAIAKLFLNYQLLERLAVAEKRSEVLRLLAAKPPRSAPAAGIIRQAAPFPS